jgi:hypothetical protein
MSISNFRDFSAASLHRRALTIHGFCDIFQTLTLFQRFKRTGGWRTDEDPCC